MGIGNRARELAVSTINGLGIEGAGKLAPANLNPDFIQSVRDQAQAGFGAYDMPYSKTLGPFNCAGQPNGNLDVTRGTLTSGDGFPNQDLETRILASSATLNLDAAGAAALNGAGTQMIVEFNLGYGDSGGIVYVPVIQLRSIFAPLQLSYPFSLHGGGLVLPGAGDWRLTGSFQGWIPAKVYSFWLVRLSAGVFPANSTLDGNALVIQQPKFNQVPL